MLPVIDHEIHAARRDGTENARRQFVAVLVERQVQGVGPYVFFRNMAFTLAVKLPALDPVVVLIGNGEVDVMVLAEVS
jgi:hypothetical protein